MSKDGRDWSTYNNELVRREERSSLTIIIIQEWKKELERQNDGKVGEPFHYPEAYVRLVAFVRLLLFHMPYRQTEGFMTFLSKYVEGLKAMDYSALNRRESEQARYTQIEASLLKSNDPVSIAVDSSGIKVHNGDDWMDKTRLEGSKGGI